MSEFLAAEDTGSAEGALEALATSVSLDPIAQSQWHLSGLPYKVRGITEAVDINVMPVWSEYTGAGVRIGIVDEGFDFSHPDLVGRFDLAASYDPRDAAGAQNIRPDTPSMSHGTCVAGIIGAAHDGNGVMGVAYDATLVGSFARFGSGGSSLAELAQLLDRNIGCDVVNNSWGSMSAFSDDLRAYGWNWFDQALDHLATDGRGGLGTVVVFAAGNDRAFVSGSASNDGDNTNAHGLTNDIRVITVAASNERGGVTTFSTPGASVFVAAPGESIVTCRPVDGDGNAANDYSVFSGTSGAAPIVSGVVALMFDANAQLGYRDVQDILAASSQRIAPTATHWQTNGATTWNGGGYLVSHDVGFGIVDAHAAVRLAETWVGQSTATNLVTVQAAAAAAFAGAIPQNGAVEARFTSPISLPDYRIEWVEVDVDIRHTHVGDLRIWLESSHGTRSLLVDRPGAGTNSMDDLDFRLTSNQFWGEGADGVWTVRIEDLGPYGSGSVDGVTVRFHGEVVQGRTYVFTDDYNDLGGGRATITASAGADIVNAAAVTSASVIDLSGAGSSTIDGKSVTFSASDHFETVFTGDANDTLIGTSAAETLNGGRGDDTIWSGGGGDTIVGGAGFDTLHLAGSSAQYQVGYDAGTATVTLRLGQVDTHVTGVESFVFGDTVIGLSSFVDRSPLAAPTPGPAMNVAAMEISERAGVDSIVGVARVESDAASRFVYSIAGPQTLFRIDAHTGIIHLTGTPPLDFETQPFHQITVVAQNGAERSESTIDVTVLDAPETNVAAAANIGLQESNGIIASLEYRVMQRANGQFVSLSSGTEISGTSQTDFIYGNDVGNLIRGGASSDYILGQGGDDVLIADQGDDIMAGGDGNDILLGASGGWLQGDDGDDTISFSGGDGVFAIAVGGKGNDVITISSAMTRSVVAVGGDGNDRIQGGSGADWLQGDSGDDIIDGGAGNDTIVAGAWVGDGGSDVSYGGAGNDIIVQATGVGRIFGGDGDDILWGAMSADELVGGRGSDQLAGFGGADRFVFPAADMAAGDHDVISGFDPGTDKIVFSQSVQNALTFTDAALGVTISHHTADGVYELFVSGRSLAAIAGDILYV